MKNNDFSILPEDLRSNVPDILNSMPGGFFVYKATGDEEVIYVNDACLRIFECDDLNEFQELTGLTFPGMVHPDDIEKVEESIQQQIDHDIYNMDYVEYRIITQDGSIRWIEDFGHYVELDSGAYFYVFITDATEKILKRRQEVEDINQELTDAYAREVQHKKLLRGALKQANAANIAKTTFLNNMSHDVRTLLNAIQGYNYLIQDHIDDQESVSLYADKISTACDQLLEVVAETLEVSRLEAGKAQLAESEANILSIMTDIQKVFDPRAKKRDVNFNYELIDIKHTDVIVDEQRIRQTLYQLLDNAIKYTPKGGNVSLSLEEMPDAPSGYARFVLIVKDTGEGMSPEFVEHMFDPFEREHNTTESGISGTGLGLTIVKHTVDLFAGHMEVDSTPGEGTTFRISFIVKIAETGSQTERIRPQRTSSQGGYILIVEDNKLNAEITESLLEDEGYKTCWAQDGKEALEIIQDSDPDKFDIILMDIQMPIMNGYETTRAIRALEDERLSTIPIIAVTSDAFPEDRKRSFDAGMDAHIAKPLSIESLKETIDQFVA